MAIPENKTRVFVTITNEEKEILQNMAEEENRNLSNYIGTILKKHIEENKKD